MHGADWPAMKAQVRSVHSALHQQCRRVPRDPVDALGTCGRSQLHHEFRRACIREEARTRRVTRRGLRTGRRPLQVQENLRWFELVQPRCVRRSPRLGECLRRRLPARGEWQGTEEPPTEVYSLFENTSGKLVEITVGPNADGKGSRTVTVQPIADEYNLRNMDWIEGNLKKVEKATDGKVGYVYVREHRRAGHGRLRNATSSRRSIKTRSSLMNASTAVGKSPTTTSTFCAGRSRPTEARAARSRQPFAVRSGVRAEGDDYRRERGQRRRHASVYVPQVQPRAARRRRTWGGLVGISGYLIADGRRHGHRAELRNLVTPTAVSLWRTKALRGLRCDNAGRRT